MDKETFLAIMKDCKSLKEVAERTGMPRTIVAACLASLRRQGDL